MLGVLTTFHGEGGPTMQAAYDGRQIVGIDLHRRRSVIVRMSETGERLDQTRIDNDPMALATEIAKAGERASSLPTLSCARSCRAGSSDGGVPSRLLRLFDPRSLPGPSVTSCRRPSTRRSTVRTLVACAESCPRHCVPAGCVASRIVVARSAAVAFPT